MEFLSVIVFTGEYQRAYAGVLEGFYGKDPIVVVGFFWDFWTCSRGFPSKHFTSVSGQHLEKAGTQGVTDYRAQRDDPQHGTHGSKLSRTGAFI